MQEICILALAYLWKGDRINGLNFVGLLMCLGGITLHVVQKIIVSKKEVDDEMEIDLNLSSINYYKPEEQSESSLPLMTQNSDSLSYLNANYFSSDDEDYIKFDDSNQILNNVLQRREQ